VNLVQASRRHWIEAVLVVVGFTLLAIVATWPVAGNITTLIPSPGSAWDPAGFIWDFWQRSTEGLGLWGDATSSFAGYPFGRGFPAAADATQLVTYGPAWIITMIAGPVAAYNVVIISGLALAGMAMYALVRWLGAGPGIATWAGGAYVICPYMIGKAVVHAPLVHLACFPLAVLAGLWWSEKLLAFLLLPLARHVEAWGAPRWAGALMATVVLLVVCGGGLVRIARSAGMRAAGRDGGTLAGLALLIVLVPVGLIGRSATDETASGISRQVIDLDNFGARLTDFVTPAGNSFLAKGLDPTWGGVTANGDERTILYVGISTIVLAIIGAVVTWRATGASGARLRLAARTAAVLVVVLAWFSLASPTTWLGISISVPSLWIWEAQPQFRVFARFAAPLMCALLVLGALGIRWIAARHGAVAHVHHRRGDGHHVRRPRHHASHPQRAAGHGRRSGTRRRSRVAVASRARRWVGNRPVPHDPRGVPPGWRIAGAHLRLRPDHPWPPERERRAVPGPAVIRLPRPGE